MKSLIVLLIIPIVCFSMEMSSENKTTYTYIDLQHRDSVGIGFGDGYNSNRGGFVDNKLSVNIHNRDGDFEFYAKPTFLVRRYNDKSIMKTKYTVSSTRYGSNQEDLFEKDFYVENLYFNYYASNNFILTVGVLPTKGTSLPDGYSQIGSFMDTVLDIPLYGAFVTYRIEHNKLSVGYAYYNSNLIGIDYSNKVNYSNGVYIENKFNYNNLTLVTDIIDYNIKNFNTEIVGEGRMYSFGTSYYFDAESVTLYSSINYSEFKSLMEGKNTLYGYDDVYLQLYPEQFAFNDDKYYGTMFNVGVTKTFYTELTTLTFNFDYTNISDNYYSIRQASISSDKFIPKDAKGNVYSANVKFDFEETDCIGVSYIYHRYNKSTLIGNKADSIDIEDSLLNPKKKVQYFQLWWLHRF